MLCRQEKEPVHAVFFNPAADAWFACAWRHVRGPFAELKQAMAAHNAMCRRRMTLRAFTSRPIEPDILF